MFTTHWHADVLKWWGLFLLFWKSWQATAVVFLLIISSHNHLYAYIVKVKWRISTGGHIQQPHIHNYKQAWYKMSPELIFTGLSDSLSLVNPVREMCCFKSCIKCFRNPSQIHGEKNVCFFSFLTSLGREMIFKCMQMNKLSFVTFFHYLT